MVGAGRDRFGGWTGLRFEATGVFYLVETDRRHWLVTPEGNAFLSLGVNHVGLKPVQAKYNAGFWRERFAAQSGDEAGFLAGLQTKVQRDMALLGANTLGCHSMNFFPDSFMPYVCTVQFVDICHWLTPTETDFLDVFAPSFVAHCEARAREVVLPRRDDPYVIGYSLIDCPIWTEASAAPHEDNIYGQKRIGLPTWPRVLRNLGGEHAGKQAYVETMRTLYADDIVSLNQVYGTVFGSFGDLLAATNWRRLADPQNEREEQDNLAFLNEVVEQYYRVVTATVRKYDPHHLIFGDKLNGNLDVPDSLIQIVGQHVDALTYQYYAFWADQEALLDRYARLTGKAILSGDASCSVPNPNMPNPFGPHCADQVERVERFREIMYNAFRRPEFLGWNWCGWIDQWAALQPRKQHSGLQDPFGNFYPIQEAMLEFSARMYDVAVASQ